MPIRGWCRGQHPVRCDEALELIGGLYAEEETIAEKKLDSRKKLLWRREHSRSTVEAFWRWCDDMVADMTRPPKDPLLKAIGYARNHRSGLEVCLQDPAVPIDTNHIERCIRPIALGRRNWMLCCNVNPSLTSADEISPFFGPFVRLT